MKIHIEYYDDEDVMVYQADAQSWDRAEMELATMEQVVKKDKLAEEDNTF